MTKDLEDQAPATRKVKGNFYKELEAEIVFDVPRDELKEEEPDIVNNQIKNGWLFEAVSQAEQAIEDLFSL